MQLSLEQSRWLLKVLQPEKTLGSLPGVAALSEAVRAALLGLPPDTYAAEQARMLKSAISIRYGAIWTAYRPISGETAAPLIATVDMMETRPGPTKVSRSPEETRTACRSTPWRIVSEGPNTSGSPPRMRPE